MERLRATIEASVDCVITIDAHSTILEFNAAAERTFGYARDEVIGKPLPETIIPPSLREAHRRGMAALLKGGTAKLLGRRVEMPAMRADSSEFPVELTITRIDSQKPPLFTAYLRDITERKRAEGALRKSEKLFTAFMDHLPGYAWIKDVEGRYLYINETFLQLRNAVGKTDAELWPAEIASTYRANDNQVMQTKNALQTIEPFPKDPEQGCQIVSKFPILDQDGAVVMVGGASVDISDLVQAEKALDVQALRYKTLMEMSTDSIYVLDAEGNLQEANAAFLRQRGYTAAEAKGLNIADWDARWTPLQLQKRLRKLVGSSAVFETRHRSKDGSLFDVEVSATSVRIGGQDLIFCVARDITGRKKAERALQESETRFRELAENISEVFWMSDPENTRMLYISPAYETIWGRPRDTLYSSPASWMEAIHPEDLARIAQMRVARSAGEPHDNIYRIVRPDGSIRWIRDRGFPVRDENGAVVRFAGIAEDITEQKRAEERLREYEKVVEGLEEMIMVIDRDYRYLIANTAYLKYHGMEREQLIGRLVPDLLDRAVFETVVKPRFDECLEGRSIRYEIKYRYEQCGERDMLVSYFPIEGRSGIDRVACVLQDITERKKAEAALRDSEARFRQLAENIEEVFWITDLAGTTIYISPGYERIWGRSRESLYAAPKSWRQNIHPEDRSRMEATFASDPGSTGDYTYRIVGPDGSIRWIRDRGFPVRAESGEVIRFAGIAEDITATKSVEEELQQANTQLRVLSRRVFQVQEEERRHLARELHDEIGQALTAVKINLAPTKKGQAGTSSVRLQEATTLLDNLIRQVRQISLDLHPSLLDDLGLAPALRSLLEQQTRRAGLRAQFSAADPLEEIGREIQTTAFRIAQEAITNILRHARAEFVALFVVTDNNQLRMKIVDDGIGFDVAKTKNGGAAERATFGLTGMKERAALLGGEVSITSSPGQGTTVELALPITENGSTP
jgi:PAS domain S-box-containing protein